MYAYVHTHTHTQTQTQIQKHEYYSAMKKDGCSSISDNMDEPWGHYAEWNKLEKDKYCMISLICGI